ncbi:MAG: hypothetical protein A3I01_17555 [Betaproteobacteria bacterium RIFCSPLOWO2_02_FULL_65_24]|nr:MAG: hypothetical protein A3I01_17555 [Betaproteobacteria bacterium RIFCSPLOWO2_02_FULL_65_24]
MRTKRWQDWVELLLGVWLVVSPWVVGYTDIEAARLNAVILGIAIVVYSVIELGVPKAWEEWVSAAMGLWLVVSPFVLNFSQQAAATWNAIVIGALILVFALWALSKDYWPHRRVTGH